jgi:ElaB/YqjD/DUF883 family membrane-anchored ribosome-binding protein
MSDEQTSVSNGGAYGSAEVSTSETVAELKSQVKTAADQAALKARTVADQAAVKAKALYGEAKDAAEKQAVQARALVVEKPYAAVGLALLAGFLLGHLISAGRPQVVYLKDRRPL